MRDEDFLKAEMLSFGWAVIEIFERKYAVLIRKEIEKQGNIPLVRES